MSNLAPSLCTLFLDRSPTLLPELSYHTPPRPTVPFNHAPGVNQEAPRGSQLDRWVSREYPFGLGAVRTREESPDRAKPQHPDLNTTDGTVQAMLDCLETPPDSQEKENNGERDSLSNFWI